MTQKIYLKALSISMVLGMGLLTSPTIAEELSPMEITSAKMEKVVQASMPQTVPSTPYEHRIGLRVTPDFGFLGSADGNQRLFNDFISGAAVDVMLSPNVSIEGIFRYARYNVRRDIPVNTQAGGYIVNTLYPPSPGQFSQQPDNVGNMRQLMLGANLKYEIFPHSIMTPFVGGGLAYFDNEYYSTGENRLGLPQHVYAGTILGGMKLRLSRAFALIGRAEGGMLMANKNGKKWWGYETGASLHPSSSFRSYDQYYVITAGVSFGI